MKTINFVFPRKERIFNNFILLLWINIEIHHGAGKFFTLTKKYDRFINSIEQKILAKVICLPAMKIPHSRLRAN